MTAHDPLCAVHGMNPCNCHTYVKVGDIIPNPVWIGDNTANPWIAPLGTPLPCNPPAPARWTIPQVAIDACGTGINVSVGKTFHRHESFKKGVLAIVNWALVGGGDGILYGDYPQTENHSGASTWISVAPYARQQLHLFQGRELVLVLDDCDAVSPEVRVAWGEKIGWVNAYLLLSYDDTERAAGIPARTARNVRHGDKTGSVRDGSKRRSRRLTG